MIDKNSTDKYEVRKIEKMQRKEDIQIRREKER